MPAAEVSIYPNRAPQIVASNGLPIREDVAYSDAKGEESERGKRRAQEAINKLHEILPSRRVACHFPILEERPPPRPQARPVAIAASD